MRDGPRWFPQNSSCSAVLRCRLDAAKRDFRVRGCHPLRRQFPLASTNPTPCRGAGPTTPGAAQRTAPVWANARSLATTCAIIVIFSSSGYLDVSVPRVRPPPCGGVAGSLPPGFPIRTSAGRRAFAPRRGFSQLVTSFFASESHRHPPCALVRLSFLSRSSALPHRSRALRRGRAGRGRLRAVKTLEYIFCPACAGRSILSSLCLLTSSRSCVSRSHHVNDLDPGGGCGIRTRGLRRAMPALYQLS